MIPGKPLLKYFTESELRPTKAADESDLAQPTFLTPAEIEDIRAIAEDFTNSGDLFISRGKIGRKPHVRTFLMFLRALGAVGIDETSTGYRLKLAGRLARHIPEIVYIYMSEPLSLIENGISITTEVHC